ncbi:uncharacterized protein EI90DRAFT_3033337 [Cantharellus anzutake]|uniref:uncharacterized protein n=1 Tax=Cantharellus anzutake TaxID=1750568 RepID=UPI0019039650|nr:uncharacterized protein EI90DRAFT_3033337 [Cantharellus anzutake]KAF8341282.1 hypothetical protein EI90DRAFT_3033337 [Cantharellus anzutake]
MPFFVFYLSCLFLIPPFSFSSHGILVNSESLKSRTNLTFVHPRALDNVMHALNGVRLPLGSVPMSAHRYSMVCPCTQ